MRAACMGVMLLLGVAVMAAPAVAQPDVSRRTGSTVADAEVPGWQWRQLRVASADGQRHYRVRVAVPKTTPPAGGFPVAYLLDGNAALMEIDAALLVQLATAPHPPVIAFIAQFFFGIKLGWFRTTVGSGASFQDLLLPGIVLGVSLYATSMRLTRASVIDTLNQDFVRTAYAKGLPRYRVVPVHVLRNSLIPTVTNMATDFGGLMVGATVTEGIFNVPGVGNVLFQAILRGENSTVVSFVTVMVLIYLAVNLIVDLLYAVLDPRIRYV